MTKMLDTAKVIKSKSGSAEFTYYAEGGGYLNSVSLSEGDKKISVLPVYESEDEIKNNSRFRCTILFPFPNRLRDGSYSFEGKDYKFPVNEEQRGNSLHGFLKQYTPEVEIKENALISKYIYDGSREYYPFPSEVVVEYALVNSSELEITFSVHNKGKASMPVGTGWHPYFSLGGNDAEKIDELLVQFPESRSVLIDERMISTGETKAYEKFKTFEKFSSTELDDCFIPLKGGVEEVAVKLWSEKLAAGIEIWQDKNFGFIQVYTPPDRQSLAVEPMSCNINAFQSNDGLSVLAPGESFSGKFGVRLFTKK